MDTFPLVSVNAVGRVKPTVSENRLRVLAKKTATACRQNRREWNISVVFVGASRVHGLNKQYRHRDRPTDVLSFDLTDKAAERATHERIGEVVFCPEMIRKRANRLKQNVGHVTEMLFVHALLHIFGFDHVNDNQDRAMKAMEVRIMGVAAE